MINLSVANIRSYDYWNLVQGSAVLIQQISTVMILFGVFMYTRDSKFLTMQSLACVDFGFMVWIYIVLAVLDPNKPDGQFECKFSTIDF